MALHYICTGGCGGVSDTVGVCQTEGCPNYGQPLEECACTDGLHGQAQEKPDEKAGEV